MNLSNNQIEFLGALAQGKGLDSTDLSNRQIRDIRKALIAKGLILADDILTEMGQAEWDAYLSGDEGKPDLPQGEEQKEEPKEEEPQKEEEGDPEDFADASFFQRRFIAMGGDAPRQMCRALRGIAILWGEDKRAGYLKAGTALGFEPGTLARAWHQARDKTNREGYRPEALAWAGQEE